MLSLGKIISLYSTNGPTRVIETEDGVEPRAIRSQNIKPVLKLVENKFDFENQAQYSAVSEQLLELANLVSEPASGEMGVANQPSHLKLVVNNEFDRFGLTRFERLTAATPA